MMVGVLCKRAGRITGALQGSIALFSSTSSSWSAELSTRASIRWGIVPKYDTRVSGAGLLLTKKRLSGFNEVLSQNRMRFLGGLDGLRKFANAGATMRIEEQQVVMESVSGGDKRTVSGGGSLEGSNTPPEEPRFNKAFSGRPKKATDKSSRLKQMNARILKGAIDLKMVVSQSSPLAKTHESKKALAEKRKLRGKEDTAVTLTMGLDAVSAEEVAETHQKLDTGDLQELRIVNEDVFKAHLMSLEDPEQKQRVSTYRTLAGRILSEIAAANSLNQGTKPSVQCSDCWIPHENCICKDMRSLSRRLWPGMRIWMLMHSKEFRRKNNTGKVMWQLFGEESVRMSISGLDVLEDEMWDEFAKAGRGRVFLMYPERKAQEKMEIFYIDTLPLPSHQNPESFPTGSLPAHESPPSLHSVSSQSPSDSQKQESPSRRDPPADPSETNPLDSDPIHFVFLDGTWNNSTAMLVRLQQQAELVWGQKMACLCLTPEEPSKMHSLRPQPALEKVCTAAAASTLLRELGSRAELSEIGLGGAADTVDYALEILVKSLQGWRADRGRSPTRINDTPAENWVRRERGSRSNSPVLNVGTGGRKEEKKAML